MEKKILRIYQVAKSNGWGVKYRHVERNNMYVLSFFASEMLDGFAFRVNVNDSDDEEIFFGNVSNAIYDAWKNFSVEEETEKYLAKIGCNSRFSDLANKIYMDVNYYIYNIYSMFLQLSE